MVGIGVKMVSMSEPQGLERAINDPSEWGTPKRGQKSEKRRRGAVVSVRMTEDELAAVQHQAARVGQTVGTFMRESALGTDVRATSVNATKLLTPATTSAPMDSSLTRLTEPKPWLQLTGGPLLTR